MRRTRRTQVWRWLSQAVAILTCVVVMRGIVLSPTTRDLAPVRVFEETAQMLGLRESSLSFRVLPACTIHTYQATGEQTDETPYTTASGVDVRFVRYAIAANNSLPLGSHVVIGGKTYRVMDRMHQRFGAREFDILTKHQNFTWRGIPVIVIEKGRARCRRDNLSPSS